MFTVDEGVNIREFYRFNRNDNRAKFSRSQNWATNCYFFSSKAEQSQQFTVFILVGFKISQ